MEKAHRGGAIIPVGFDAPELPTKLYANLGREAEQDNEDVFAIIWNGA